MDDFCKLMSDFSMEYRTTHDKVLARLERKKHERERKKTKGKFIVSHQLYFYFSWLFGDREDRIIIWMGRTFAISF